MELEFCDALKFAIDFERKGRGFYLDAIQKAEDPLAKKTLKFLADEEVHHIEKIEKFNQALLGKGDFDIEKECHSDLPQRTKEYIDKATQDKEEKVSPQTTDIEVYDLALDMEKSSYDIYKDAFEKNSDEKLKRFFQFLMQEEQIHYDLLAASKKYLEDPSYYFEEFGGWIFA